MQPGTRFGLPQDHAERGAYVAKGSVEVNGQRFGVGQLLIFTPGIDPVLIANETCCWGASHWANGSSAGPPVRWNFVSSQKERIKQAKADWEAGRIPLPPNDNAEFVPLPQDRTKPAGSPPPQALS
ncbi:pirin-like C-terminal cupin domain-containing protein [Spirosoma fluminis]